MGPEPAGKIFQIQDQILVAFLLFGVVEKFQIGRSGGTAQRVRCVTVPVKEGPILAPAERLENILLGQSCRQREIAPGQSLGQS